MPQSIVPSSTIAARRCSCGSRRGCTVMRVGDVDLGLGDALDGLRGDRGVHGDRELRLRLRDRARAGRCAVAASRTSVKTFSSWPW